MNLYYVCKFKYKDFSNLIDNIWCTFASLPSAVCPKSRFDRIV